DAVSRLLESFSATNLVLGVPATSLATLNEEVLSHLRSRYHVEARIIKNPYEGDDFGHYLMVTAESKEAEMGGCREEVTRIINKEPPQATAGLELGAGPRAVSASTTPLPSADGEVAAVVTPEASRPDAAAATSAAAAEQMRRSSQIMQMAPQMTQQQQYANAATANQANAAYEASVAMWQQQQQQQQQLQRQHSMQ
ncbi:hypothetical protein FOZ63_011436, partial [Perkinsus olseni]